jgi:hypothetical protein
MRSVLALVVSMTDLRSSFSPVFAPLVASGLFATQSRRATEPEPKHCPTGTPGKLGQRTNVLGLHAHPPANLEGFATVLHRFDIARDLGDRRTRPIDIGIIGKNRQPGPDTKLIGFLECQRKIACDRAGIMMRRAAPAFR